MEHKQAMTDTKTFSQSIFLGASILADVVSLSPEIAGTAMSLVLTGSHKRELLAFMFFRAHNRYPNPGEDWEQDSEAAEALDAIVKNIRYRLQAAILQEAHLEEQKRRQNLLSLQQKLRTSNRPDPLGTISELATRFNKSKSEIRRLKAEGMLHTLEAVASPTQEER